MAWHRSVHRVLGTSVEVTVDTGLGRSARRVGDCLLAEMQRLETVFNIYSPDSEITRLISATSSAGSALSSAGPARVPVSPELATVLRLAAQWHDITGGRFDPMIGRAVTAWRDGEQTARVPGERQLAELVAPDQELPFRVDGYSVVVTAPLIGLNVNGLAKGWILDRVVEESGGPARAVVVNAGGDVRRCGRGQLLVRIEDPARPYDNAEPLTTATVVEGAVATSGSSRRPVRIGDEPFNHILDADTGLPAAEVAAATVTAPSAATADVLATTLASRPLADAASMLTSELLSDGAAALVVGVDATVLTSPDWGSAPRT